MVRLPSMESNDAGTRRIVLLVVLRFRREMAYTLMGVLSPS